MTKKTKRISPTALSLKELRKRGYMVAVVEKFNPWVKIRQDLFSFGDILAVHSERMEFLIVQATTGDGGNVAARVAKIKENNNAKTWVKAGGKISVWGWRKVGNKGKGKLWTLRDVEVKNE